MSHQPILFPQFSSMPKLSILLYTYIEDSLVKPHPYEEELIAFVDEEVFNVWDYMLTCKRYL